MKVRVAGRLRRSATLVVSTAAALALVAGAGCWACAPAGALILAPTTLAGPSSQIGEFGGTAVSADGTGGIVYAEQVEGVAHVFAAAYAVGRWQAPKRVDWKNSNGATFPRIAAANGGRLVVVWVSQIATVRGRPQRALYSSTLDPGASSFGEPFVVDANVGEGAGVDPSVALAAGGQGLVVYRVVTNNFQTSLEPSTIPQLRPGDVLADIRLAEYQGQWWSTPVRIDRDPRLTTRAPTEANGPQAGIGNGDQAVVSWQESESNGTARIWARRVFGSTLGLAMQVSPTVFQGQPIDGDVDAFALGVSKFGEAKVVTLVAGEPGTALGGPRMFSDTLPSSTLLNGGQFTGATPLDPTGAPLAGVGLPSVAVDDQGNFRIAFTAGTTAELLKGGEGTPAVPGIALGPAVASTGAGAATALNPEGGGVTAWPATGARGLGVGVREDFPDGAAQSALLAGAAGGPVSRLAAAGSESGEALVGFRAGEPGSYEIVGVPVTAPPPAFLVEVPRGWVTPARVRLSWTDAEDATGGVTYALILDGRNVQRGVHGLVMLPDQRLLSSGVHSVQILATDASAQQTLSGESQLKVDGSPPVATVRRGRRGSVVVRVKDAQSGALAAGTRISFGDGAHATGRLTARHSYARPGRYVVVVQMRDRVGNRATARFPVSVA